MGRNSAKNRLSAEDIRQAVHCVKKGGIISFPTETYYGLGVDPFNEEAIEKLFTIKGRKHDKPISLIVSSVEMLSQLTETIPHQYTSLMSAYWPGPLTLIFQAKRNLSPLLTGGTGTVGVRISSHSTPTLLCKSLRHPLTATSANLSGKPPAKNVHEILRYFGDKISFTCKGHPSTARSCSTIVGISGEKLQLLRKGEIAFAEILKKAQETI